MKKIFLTFAGLLSLGTGHVFAIAGGPFDNGDPGGLLMERGGYYASTFSFRNGNGYGIFTSDAVLSGNGLSGGSVSAGINNTSLGLFGRGSLYAPNTASAAGHNANRSIFYYKGVTYAGSCFGYPDLEKRFITGGCNASSDESSSQQTLAQSNTGLVSAAGVATTVQNIVSSNAGFVINLGFTAKIYSTRPTLRYRGKGEMSILSPSGQSTIAALAFQGYSGLIDAIVNAVAGANIGANFNDQVFTSAQTAISNALGATGLGAYVNNGSAGQRFEEAEVVRVRVEGSRRFF